MRQIPNRFHEWEFDKKEAYIATRFSQFNLALIQTLIAQAAIRRTNLNYDPTNHLNFIQQEAEIKGEIGALEHLLMLATETTAPDATEEAAPADVSKTAPQPLETKPK